jgi:hypothetical protein
MNIEVQRFVSISADVDVTSVERVSQPRDFPLKFGLSVEWESSSTFSANEVSRSSHGRKSVDVCGVITSVRTVYQSSVPFQPAR